MTNKTSKKKPSIHLEQGKQFNYAIDNFRALSIIFVIISHLSLYGLGELAKPIKFIFADATTFFIFISGFLFYHLSKNNFNLRDYIGKKIRFVGSPYLFISSVLISIGVALDHHTFFGLQPISYAAFSLWAGGLINSPTWFIPMIWCFFILSPFLIFIASKNWFPIIVIFTMLISIFSARPFMNANPILSTIHFLGFYMLGMYISKNQWVMNKARDNAKKIVIVSVAVTIVLYPFYIEKQYGVDVGFSAGFLNPNFLQIAKLFMLIAIFTTIDKYFNKRYLVMNYIANISFGLFFIHGLWLAVANKILASMDVSNAASNVLQITFVIIGSIVSITVSRKILGKRSKYVIGC